MSNAVPDSNRFSHVLVVDDDPMAILLAKESLKHFNFKVSDAANGEEALTCFNRLRPDIVMLDVRMPIIDGFSACSQLRDHPAGKFTPIIMVTGLDDFESINRAYEAGATDFVTKPVNWQIIGHRLRYILRACKSIEAHHKIKLKNTALLDAVRTLITHYISESPKTFASLREAINANDVGTMQELAHSLKSASANVGALTVAELCKEMELVGRTGITQSGVGLLLHMEMEFDIASKALMAEL